MSPIPRKYVDTTVMIRAFNEALAKLSASLFVAALGPLAIGVIKMWGFVPSSGVRYGILATTPVAILLLLVNYVRLPAPARKSHRAARILLLTIGLALATPILAHLLGLLPA